MLVVLALVVGGVAAWPWLQPRLAGLPGPWAAWLGDRGAAVSANSSQPMPTLAERVEMLEASLAPLAIRFEYIEQRLTQLEAVARKPAATEPRRDAGVDPAQLAKLAEDVAKLRTDLDTVRKFSGEDGGAAKLSGAVEKAEAAFRRMAERRDQAPLFLTALGQLREAVDRGGPYQVELRAAAALADKAAIGRLAPLGGGAATGIVTRVGLAEGFRSAAASARRADALAGTDWAMATLRHWLGAAVTVRRADGSEDGLEGALSGAGRLLAGGDLAGAVVVLRHAEGAGAAMLAPWLEAAEQRLAADAALSELSAAALATAAHRDE